MEVPPSLASAATWCVNPSGTSGCQKTISAAVSAASSGDTIYVARGHYKEGVIITKSLSLKGAGDRTTDHRIAHGQPNGIRHQRHRNLAHPARSRSAHLRIRHHRRQLRGHPCRQLPPRVTIAAQPRDQEQPQCWTSTACPGILALLNDEPGAEKITPELLSRATAAS